MIIKDMNHSVRGMTFDIDASFKPYKESTETKQVTLRFHFDDVPLKDIFTKACSSARISWQNGPGRAKFDTWKDRQVVPVNFTAPGVKVKTREEKIEEYKVLLIGAGMKEDEATVLATKMADNPDVIPSK